MRHASEEAMLAYVDGELAPDERARLADHLTGCARCRETLDELNRRADRLSGALRAIDRPAPRRARPGAARTAAASQPATERGGRRVWLKAAVLLLAVTGVASALPNSPVRDWLARSIAGWMGGAATERTADRGAAADRGAPDPAGVVAEPVDGAVRVRIHDAAPGTRIEVRIVPGGSASVMADRATFRTGPGRIEADLSAAAGPVAIEIPRAARSARIELNGELAWEKDGTAVRRHRPAEESADGATVFRASG